VDLSDGSDRSPARTFHLLGIDLAWGDRNPDGVCAIKCHDDSARVTDIRLTRGDAELLDWVSGVVDDQPAFITIDAPIICPNKTGSRPVDRMTHVHFGRYKCGCYPANRTKCPRPPRLLGMLENIGFHAGWELGRRARVVAEVYPHPAMVRMFGLAERIRYKKGTVLEKREAFRELQRHLRRCLKRFFPPLDPGPAGPLLRKKWTKQIEDQTDALFCALLGLWHFNRAPIEILGDLASGFILLPVVTPQLQGSASSSGGRSK